MTNDNALATTVSPEVQIRLGTPQDARQAFNVLADAVEDLAARIGAAPSGYRASDTERNEDFRRWQPLLAHLANSADQFWVAERNGELVGIARATLRDGVRELTEFFVSPTLQSGGVGRELLQRAMPPGARRTYIMATPDLRAQARYHKLGVYQICAVYTFSLGLTGLVPPPAPISDLRCVPITATALPQLAAIDRATHDYRRDEDHTWLMQNRQGFLLLRKADGKTSNQAGDAEQAVGYGYVGAPYSGPFALLDGADFPTALAYAERIAFDHAIETLGLDVPMLNRPAIQYLLGRGYQLSPFFCYYMCSDQPRHVDKTIITGPMILI